MGSRNNDVATLSAVGSIRSRTISRLVRESRIGKVPRFINRVFAHPTPVAIFSDRAGKLAAIVGGDGVAWLKFVETRAKVGVGREEDDRHGVKSGKMVSSDRGGERGCAHRPKTRYVGGRGN